MIPAITMLLGSASLTAGIYFRDQHHITVANIYFAATMIVVALQ